jgi:tyrosyl-tRNA synthetase
MAEKSEKIKELLERGVEKIYPSKEALESVLESGKKIRLYQGFDPTGPKLHIGHLAGLMKLKQFQEAGHKVIFLIGDITATIGDPSGKTMGRTKLSREEVNRHAKNYKKQVSRILDFNGDNPVELRSNSEWYDKMDALEFANISHYLTYNQIIERDLFQKRKDSGRDIFISEFIYPMLQAYDSVVMDVDLEIGGNDQMFNMMMGRKLMRNMKKKEKYVLTVPLLTDNAGNKIGKTEGNIIALDAKPSDFYGMIMSLPDDVVVKCFESVTDIPMDEVKEIEHKIKTGENPMVYKKQLAFYLTQMLNNREQAEKAQAEFEKVFSKKELPTEIPEIKVASGNYELPLLMINLEAVPSVTKARLLIEQGAVKVDEAKITDPKAQITVYSGMVVQVGKRSFYKIK